MSQERKGDRKEPSMSFQIYMYVYVNIYMYVCKYMYICVCVCVYIYPPIHSNWGFHGSSEVKTLPGHRFNPWIEKIPWRIKSQPTLAFLPGKSRGQRSLVGYSPGHCRRVKHNLATKERSQQLLPVK